MRLFTRRGYDWYDRYPRIIEVAKRIKGTFTIDGEAVVSDERGISDFEKLHSREHDKSAMLWAFDLLELNGEDLRQLPLDQRKSKLAKLLKGSRHHGIVLNEHLKADAARAFAHACKLGFEGIVSKRRDSRYVSGRSKTWPEGQESECTWRAEVSGPGTGGTIRSAQHLWKCPRIWVMRDPGWDEIGRTGKLDVRCNAASNHSDCDFAGRTVVETYGQALIQEHWSM